MLLVSLMEMDNSDEISAALTECRDLQRQIARLQKSIAISNWLLVACAVPICFGVLVEVSVVALFLISSR
jgi:hypothetical protein